MKRLRRWTFNGVAAVSALLSVATCVLWLIRSLGGGYYFVVQGPTKTFVVAATSSLLLRVGDTTPDAQRPATYRCQRFGGEADGLPAECFEMGNPSLWSRLGVFRTVEYVPVSAGVTSSTATPSWCRSFMIPWSLLAIAFLFLPLRRARQFLRQRVQRLRTAQGQCVVCGYDLRATPGVCPECGSVSTPTATPKAPTE